MKKRKTLTPAQFHEAVNGLDVGKQTLDIAYGVLVEGKSQVEFVDSLHLTKGAVSQAVNRVWIAAQSNLPKGFEKLTVVLPAHQAYIVKKWAEEAQRKKP